MLATRSLATFELAGGSGSTPPRPLTQTLPTFVAVSALAAEVKLIARASGVALRPRTTEAHLPAHALAVALNARTTDVKLGRQTDVKLSEGIYS